MIEEGGRVIRRECDEPMARSKKLLPCNKDCKHCMACIEVSDTGERRHCTRHKSNTVIDRKIVTGGMKPESWKNDFPCREPRNCKHWTEIETKRLVFLREQDLTWREIGERMHRSIASVYQQYQRAKEGGEIEVE